MSFLTQVGSCDTISVTAYYAAHLCHHHNTVIQAHFKALGTSAHPQENTFPFLCYTVVKLYSGAKAFFLLICVLIKRNTINRKLEGVALRHSLVHPTAHSPQPPERFWEDVHPWPQLPETTAHLLGKLQSGQGRTPRSSYPLTLVMSHCQVPSLSWTFLQNKKGVQVRDFSSSPVFKTPYFYGTGGIGLIPG